MKTIIYGLGKNKSNRDFIPTSQFKKLAPGLLSIRKLRNNAKKHPVKLNKMLSDDKTNIIAEKIYSYLKTDPAFSHRNLSDIKKQIRLDNKQYDWVLTKLNSNPDANTALSISMWCLKKK